MFVGAIGNPALMQYEIRLVVDQRDQLNGGLKRSQRATKGLAIKADPGDIIRGRNESQPFRHPACECNFEGDRIKLHQQIAEAIFLGRPAAVSHLMANFKRNFVQPFDEGFITANAAEKPGNNRRQHGGKRKAYSLVADELRTRRPRGSGTCAKSSRKSPRGESIEIAPSQQTSRSFANSPQFYQASQPLLGDCPARKSGPLFIGSVAGYTTGTENSVRAWGPSFSRFNTAYFLGRRIANGLFPRSPENRVRRAEVEESAGVQALQPRRSR